MVVVVVVAPVTGSVVVLESVLGVIAVESTADSPATLSELAITFPSTEGAVACSVGMTWLSDVEASTEAVPLVGTVLSGAAGVCSVFPESAVASTCSEDAAT